MNPGYLLIAGSIFLTSCTVNPTTQIRAFANATQAISENVDKVITEYNNAVLERQYTEFAASYNGKNANQLTSKALAGIKEPITPARKKQLAVYQANKALGDYASALGKLASAEIRDDIDQAVVELHGVFTSLDTHYRLLRPDQAPLIEQDKLSLFSSLLASMGNAIVEEKRRKAIRELVLQADPAIALICDMLDEQLKTADIEQGIASSRQYVLTEEILEYKSRVKADTTLDWRRSEVKRLHKLQQEVTTAKLLLQKTRRAIIAIKKSHATLAKEVNNNVYSSAAITSTIGQLKAMARHYDDIESLLLECTKISTNSKGSLNCDD